MDTAHTAPLTSRDSTSSKLPRGSLNRQVSQVTQNATETRTVAANCANTANTQSAQNSSVIPIINTPTEYKPFKHGKDTIRIDEGSEYVNCDKHDPSAPVYEITHSLPDTLILKCADCQRFAKVQHHLPGMELPPGPGDRGYFFKCSRCNGGHQLFRHSEKTWLEITLTSLYNLELQDRLREGRRFFHVRQEICSFADKNWDIICLGRTRTPTWWATLNAQITTRTDLFETSKHGSGNWALRHSNVTHPIQRFDPANSLDPNSDFTPEKPNTLKFNATSILSKQLVNDRVWYLVSLEGSPLTVWRDSSHPSLKSGELIKQYTKTEAANKSKNAASKGSPQATTTKYHSHLNTSPIVTNALGPGMGVFTQKVGKTPSRLSKRQQAIHDAAVAAALAAASSSSSNQPKPISKMADLYRKTAKVGIDQVPAAGTWTHSKNHVQSVLKHTAPISSSSNMLSPTLSTPAEPVRCHQCNRRQLSRPKPGQEFLNCTNMIMVSPPPSTSPDQPTAAPQMELCSQKFCSTCIDLIYHEEPLKNQQESTWTCPSCRKICTCATCNSYESKSSYSSQSHSALIVPPSSSASQQPAANHYTDSSDSPVEDWSSITHGTSSHATPSGSASLSPNSSLYGNSTQSSQSPNPHKSPATEKPSGWVKNCSHIAARIDRRSKLRYLVKTVDTPTAPASYKWVTDKKPKDGHAPRPSKIDDIHHKRFERSLKIVLPAFTVAQYQSSGRKSGDLASPGRPRNSELVKSESPATQVPPVNRSNYGTRSASNGSVRTINYKQLSNGKLDLRQSTVNLNPPDSPVISPVSSSTSNTTRSAPSVDSQISAYITPGAPLPNGFTGLVDSKKKAQIDAFVRHVESPIDGINIMPSTNSIPTVALNVANHGLFEAPYLKSGPRNKAKRPHSDLTASSMIHRRSSSIDGFEPLQKRRLVSSSMDDMADLMGDNLHSPRVFSDFSDDEDTPLRSASLHHHHHHHHHHHSPHDHDRLVLDDSVVKDPSAHLQIDMQDDAPSLVEHVSHPDDADIIHSHLIHSEVPVAAVVASASINPSQIVEMAEFLGGSHMMDSNINSLVTEDWNHAIPYESAYF